ncbi:MAG: hypothetical protein HGA54_07000 [Actinobacteria bacterium]|nr:hypothetical protein [Actinomycetota bacterium]
MYNYDVATQAIVKFYEDFPILDAQTHPKFASGRANELLGTQIIDWPGKPGTKVADHCNFQVNELEFMQDDEYAEILEDYTGFMLRKHMPRLYRNLKGFEKITMYNAVVLGTVEADPFMSAEMLESYKVFFEAAAENVKCAEAQQALNKKITEMGFPAYSVGGGEVPYDVIGDYFRGTVGVMEDMLTAPQEVEALCYKLADLQIEKFQYLKNIEAPVKCIFFPLHKGMDGFMSDEMYERLYWRPYMKVIEALVDLGATPYVYTEGKYSTRLKYLEELPEGKCLIHFETIDMVEAKQRVGSKNCISGNLDMSLLYFAKPERVREETKKVLDICMPGGGYIFDTSGNFDMVKRENIEAMFETIEEYGKY